MQTEVLGEEVREPTAGQGDAAFTVGEQCDRVFEIVRGQFGEGLGHSGAEDVATALEEGEVLDSALAAAVVGCLVEGEGRGVAFVELRAESGLEIGEAAVAEPVDEAQDGRGTDGGAFREDGHGFETGCGIAGE